MRTTKVSRRIPTMALPHYICTIMICVHSFSVSLRSVTTSSTAKMRNTCKNKLLSRDMSKTTTPLRRVLDHGDQRERDVENTCKNNLLSHGMWNNTQGTCQLPWLRKNTLIKITF